MTVPRRQFARTIRVRAAASFWPRTVGDDAERDRDVARDGEVPRPPRPGPRSRVGHARDDQLAVRLQHAVESLIVGAGRERGHHGAAAAVRRIEPATSGQPGDGEVSGPGASGGHRADHEDPAVRLDRRRVGREVARAGSSALAEAPVEAAVGIEARDPADSGYEQLPVPLHEELFTDHAGGKGRRNNHAVTVETGVEAAVRVVAGEDDVPPTQTLVAVAGGNELAIGLDGEGEEPVGGIRDRRGDASAVSEAPIELPVRQVPREGEIRVGSGPEMSARNDLPVGLEQDRRRGDDVAFLERRENHAAVTEGRIEASIRVVARKSDISSVALLLAQGAPAGGHDLAVALDRDIGCPVDAVEVGFHLAVCVEGRVQDALRRVAREHEVVGVRLGAAAGDDDLPVRLDRDGPADLGPAEVGRHFAARAEGRVKVTARRGEQRRKEEGTDAG